MGRSPATPAARKRSASRTRTPAKKPKKPAKAPAKAAGRKAPARRAATSKPRSRRPSISWRSRLVIATVAVIGLAGGYLFWLRDSSLVAIDNVDVVGVRSADREQIVTELTRAGKSMTTLHLDRARLERVAAPFPTVESVDLDPNFPHGLRIEVTETPPVSVISAGDRTVPLAADGNLLEGVQVPEAESLPVIEVEQLPSGDRLAGKPLEQAVIVGAAPEALRPMIESVDHDDALGVVVSLRGEIPVRFGTEARALEKWAAASAVLADPKLDALTYIDVRVPERPAAGGATIAGLPTNPPA